MILAIYLLKCIVISGLLCFSYITFLKNQNFHQYNRMFLLFIPVVSLLIPLCSINLDLVQSPGPVARGYQILQVVTGSEWEKETAGKIQANERNFLEITRQYWLSLYFIISALFLFVLVRSLLKIHRIKSKGEMLNIKGVPVYFTSDSRAPFSWFKAIFWHREMDIASQKGKQIFLHEYYHIKQKHSADLLYLEILSALCWINPVFYFLKKEIRALHEFQADAFAVEFVDRYDYAELLITQTIAQNQFKTSHPFFQNHIKRRIMMITKKQTRAGARSALRKAMPIPVVLLLLAVFSFKIANRKAGDTALNPKNPITVIIDPGHGGMDNGALSADGKTKESDLNLSLSKKIKQLAAGYNVKVILTRESDELPGNLQNISDALNYRTTYAQKYHADLFVSIHVNNALNDVTATGIDIIVSNRKQEDQKSVELGSALLNAMSKSYATNPQLKKRDQGIRVLDNATVPAVIVECGYITNAKDLAFISDEKNQEKIASDILQGIVQFDQKK